MKQHHFKNLIMIVLLFCTTISAFAQENNPVKEPVFKKHEFNVSVGVVPLVGYLSFFLGIDPHPDLGYYVRDVRNYGLKVGAFNFEYNYNISTKFSTGYAFSYSMIKTRKPWITKYYNLFSNQIFLKYKYFENEKFCFYSSIYFGFTYGLSIKYPGVDYRHNFTPNLHICVFGTTIKQNLFLEVGSGNQGVFKIGYKF